MASTSSINNWIDQLVNSISPSSKTRERQTSRRITESFRRRVRNHNYGRTNQFDVENRLDGLEEKFQVLNRDDLSDALYNRRIELRDHFQQWIPDVLDLLLRLSDNPVHKTTVTNLHDAGYTGEAPAPLKWADIEADDPVDHSDPIWKVPEFSDLSSDEDEVEVSTTSTSPSSTRQNRRGLPHSEDWQHKKAFVTDVQHVSASLIGCLQLPDDGDSLIVTEVQLIRQCLVTAQGLPSVIFGFEGKRLYLDPRVQTHSTSNEVLQALLRPLQAVHTNHGLVIDWAGQKFERDYMQRIGQSIERVTRRVTAQICEMEEHMLRPNLKQALSLISTMDRIEKIGRPLALLADWIRLVARSDPISVLEALYQLTCQRYFSGDDNGTGIVLSMFVEALSAYLEPVRDWVTKGTLQPQRQPFFIKTKDADCPLNTMWHQSFELHADGPYRAPSFLEHVVQNIFACGKTVAFANQISGAPVSSISVQLPFDDALQQLRSLASDSVAPFPAAFSIFLSELFSATLSSATLELKNLLETRCAFSRTLDAFDLMYLHKDGVVLDAIESRIFARIDRCMDNWNDRFLIADMLEDVYGDIDCIDLESISVRSVHTSSRSMESRRRSVRILGALAVDYAVPWPVANIIPRASLNGYRRVALHLSQIRRVKHMLERVAYTHVNTSVISDEPRDQMLAQTTTFMLIQFANTLYDHFTTGFILPATREMRDNLHAASTVDAMIRVHKDYITNLEFVCLTNKPLKVLRDALIGLLDMCIRFADLVSSDHGRSRRRGSDDFETSSFMSARSHHTLDKKLGRPRGRDADDGDESSSSDEDDEDDDEDGFGDEGEGYSSFIVLDEDTTVAQEIRKLQVQFKRQLVFFVAGLRGVGTGGRTVEEFEMLADRLDWKGR